MRSRAWALCLLGAGLLAGPGIGQTSAAFEVPTTNSRAEVQQWVASTEIEVSYSRPSVRGREIFGALVPYGKVWRTGADKATRISFSTPVSIQEAPLDAGEYELFTIPGDGEWVVILQPAQSQWGSYAYDPVRDALRVTAPPVALKERVESFTIGFDDVTTSSTSTARRS